MAQQVAEELGIGKRAVNKRMEAASAAIGEKIDLDRDTPEELERKADKRLHAKPKVERPKRRKPAPRGVIEDPTRSVKPHAAEIDRQMEDLRKAFDAIDRQHQLRFIHDACLRVGLDPLKMAPPSVFRLAREEPEFAVDTSAEVAPAADHAAVASEVEPPAPSGLADENPELAVALPAEVAPAADHAAVASEAEQQDDAADPGSEDLQDAGDQPPAASGVADHEPALAEIAPATDHAAVASEAERYDDPEGSPAEVPPASDDAAQDSLVTDEPADDSLSADNSAADSKAEPPEDAADGAENVQDAGDDVPEAADPEIGVTKCPQCKGPFTSSDPAAPEMINGRRYHLNKCFGWAKENANAAA